MMIMIMMMMMIMIMMMMMINNTNPRTQMTQNMLQAAWLVAISKIAKCHDSSQPFENLETSISFGFHLHKFCLYNLFKLRGEHSQFGADKRKKKKAKRSTPTSSISERYGGCPKFFLLETAILSRKKIYFSQTFAILTKNFRGALCCVVSGNFC